MDDVQRVFTLLVRVLTESDPARLRAPLEVAEIYQTILPYRSYRSELAFDTNQDYEMAVLRLLSGEGGFASVDPAEVQTALAEEVRSVNPNPGAFRDYAAARVFLNTHAVDTTTSTDEAYAPPSPDPVATVEEVAVPYAPPPNDMASAPTLPFTPVETVEEAPPVTERPSLEALGMFHGLPDPDQPGPSACPSCTRLLPRRADLRYCPFCGMDVTTPSCRFCGTDLDPEWAYCVACGRHKSPDS